MAFFNWNEIYDEFEHYANVPLWIVLGPRNIGKSTATYNYLIDNNYFTPAAKVLILRNTDAQQKEMIKDFNNRFKEKFYASGSHIYQLNATAVVDNKTGDITYKYSKGEVVGYIASINTYTNLKSVEAKDVKFIFYEEFNEDSSFGKNLYMKFINIITTFQRFSKVKMVMLGNKDCFNNDYFVNWNILPNEDTQEDKITEIYDIDGEDILGVCLDLGNKRFADLENENTLSNKLAQLDGRTALYARGGYSQTIINNVRNVRSFIDKFEPLYKLAVANANYVLGKVGEMYAIISPWNWIYGDYELPVYALDALSRTHALTLTKTEIGNVLKSIIHWFKTNQIIFDSYDTLTLFETITKFVALKV